MSEAERESLAEVLRAELSDAVWNGAIPDLGNPNTGFAQRQIAEWVVASDWLAQHDAAVLASGDARLAAVEALGLFERWGVALPAADGFINPSQVEYASGREGAEHKAEVLNDVRPSSHPERFVPVRCWTSEWEPALHSDPSVERGQS